MNSTPPPVAAVVQQLKRILIEDLQLDVTPEEIPDDYSLLEDGLALDSILVEEFIALIEDRFALRFDDRVLRVELLANLSRLADFVVEELATMGQCSRST